MAAEKRDGIDGSLAILRRELECMQKQDKDLYNQLLLLQGNIRGLKDELKREREECEEAFRDLQVISFDDECENEQHQPKWAESDLKQSDGKHERQDSGISEKTSSEPELINTSGIPVKPPLIQHNKQDSGILIDEEAINETKLLSQLVQSSSGMFSSVQENRKMKYPSNNASRCEQVIDKVQNNRSKSSNDLLREKSSRHPSLIPKHERTKSYPSTPVKTFIMQDCQYYAVASHQTRPKKRSASVVDLTKFCNTTQDGLVEQRKTENERIIKTECTPQSFHRDEPPQRSGYHYELPQKSRHQNEPLQAVFVCADEVSVSSTYQQRRAVARETGSQRRFMLVGSKPHQYYGGRYHVGQSDELVTRSPMSPFPSPRDHVRHYTMPENLTRRHHSMQVRHVSSQSWDGNMGRSRTSISTLLRSNSQVSLV